MISTTATMANRLLVVETTKRSTVTIHLLRTILITSIETITAIRIHRARSFPCRRHLPPHHQQQEQQEQRRQQCHSKMTNSNSNNNINIRMTLNRMEFPPHLPRHVINHHRHLSLLASAVELPSALAWPSSSP